MTDTRERFQDIIESFTTGMLVTTVRDTGKLRGRPMRIAHTSEDATLWFACRNDSGKAADIRADEDVAVVFQDSGRYATISGTANLIHDADRIEELWNESWRIWFPDGKDDPSLVLLKVESRSGEYWDNSGLRAMTLAIQAGQAYWRGESPDVSDDINAKVDLSAG